VPSGPDFRWRAKGVPMLPPHLERQGGEGGRNRTSLAHCDGRGRPFSGARLAGTCRPRAVLLICIRKSHGCCHYRGKVGGPRRGAYRVNRQIRKLDIRGFGTGWGSIRAAGTAQEGLRPNRPFIRVWGRTTGQSRTWGGGLGFRRPWWRLPGPDERESRGGGGSASVFAVPSTHWRLCSSDGRALM